MHAILSETCCCCLFTAVWCKQYILCGPERTQSSCVRTRRSPARNKKVQESQNLAEKGHFSWHFQRILFLAAKCHGSISTSDVPLFPWDLRHSSFLNPLPYLSYLLRFRKRSLQNSSSSRSVKLYRWNVDRQHGPDTDAHWIIEKSGTMLSTHPVNLLAQMFTGVLKTYWVCVNRWS